jgi:hypothetical protein
MKQKTLFFVVAVLAVAVGSVVVLSATVSWVIRVISATLT